MPGFNQTGPFGQGPMTGRRMGKCTNFGASLKNSFTDKNQDDNNQDYSILTRRRLRLSQGHIGKGKGMGWKNRF